jgi:hypothetical protein
MLLELGLCKYVNSTIALVCFSIVKENAEIAFD